MRVIVFGYEGKVGSVVASALRAAGHEVLGYDVDPATLSGSSTITNGRWDDVTRSVFDSGDLVSTTYDDGTAIATTVTYVNDPKTHEVLTMIDPDGSVSEQPYEDDHRDCLWW